MVISEHFEFIHSTESNIGNVTVTGRDLIIPIRNIFISPGHPLFEKGSGPYDGKFIFHDVYLTKRELIEYIGDPMKPDGYKEKYVVEDLEPCNKGQEETREYAFEGIADEPTAWVDWCIEAKSFEFDVEI